jgi:hypothetical protein
MTTVTRGERAPDDAHETTTYELTTDQTSNAARKYHIWTIGCQMNVADSNHVAAELEKIGYGPTDRCGRGRRRRPQHLRRAPERRGQSHR